MCESGLNQSRHIWSSGFMNIIARKQCPPLTESQRALVVDNLSLAYWTANRWKKRPLAARTLTYLDGDEVESAAVYGLCLAAQRYDPNYGVKFSTYAVTVMNDQINIAMRHACPISVPVCVAKTSPEKRSEAITQRMAKIFESVQAGEMLTRNDRYHPQIDFPMGEIEGRDTVAMVEAWANETDKLAGQVVRLRFVEELGYKEIAERLGITRDRARSLVRVAMETVRARVMATSWERGW